MRGKAKSILHHKVSPVSGCERSNGLGQPCFEAPIPCHTWPHALGFPIRGAKARFVELKSWAKNVPPNYLKLIGSLVTSMHLTEYSMGAIFAHDLGC